MFNISGASDKRLKEHGDWKRWDEAALKSHSLPQPLQPPKHSPMPTDSEIMIIMMPVSR